MIERGVEVGVIIGLVNKAAPSGWMERLVRFLDFWGQQMDR